MQASHGPSANDTSLGVILRVIREAAPISRSDITEATGLASSTVSVATSELQRRNLIRECGHALSTGGRRPVLLEINPPGGHFICVDLSGTEMSIAVLDLAYHTRGTWSYPFPAHGGEALYDLLISGLEQAALWCDASACAILAIGVATPGLVDAHSGTIVEADNLQWHDFPLRDKLKRVFTECPILIHHDATAATYGEFKFGHHDDGPVQNLMYVTMGGGIGAGLVLNGFIYAGSGGMAGELGHVVVVPGGPRCVCGNHGCLEAIAGQSAVAEAYRRAVCAEGSGGAGLGGQLVDARIMDSAYVIERAKLGDRLAIDVLESAGRAVGTAIGNQVNMLNLDMVLIGGTLAQDETVYDAIHHGFYAALMPKLHQSCTIKRASLGTAAGLVGIAALALEHIF